MSSVNKVILIGNLGAKPELKFLPSGQAVAEMRLATNESYTDKDKNKQEKVEWHSIVLWGKTAENCTQYLDKGRQVYVEGRLQTRTWDDKTSGEKKYKTEIVANVVQFLGGKGGEDRSSAPGKPKGADVPPPGGGDDDIPF